jgi:hypothetical protein
MKHVKPGCVLFDAHGTLHVSHVVTLPCVSYWLNQMCTGSVLRAKPMILMKNCCFLDKMMWYRNHNSNQKLRSPCPDRVEQAQILNKMIDSGVAWAKPAN